MIVSGSAVFRKLAVFGCAWSVCSSLWIYPHSLSYFNELVGGPMNGQQHLLDSNMDWGQDLFYCAKLFNSEIFLSKRPELFYYGPVQPQELGMDFNYPKFANTLPLRLPPGKYAVSVNFVQGKRNSFTTDGNQRVEFDPDRFSPFRDKAPIEMAGYSIRIYQGAD